jgi:oligopeptide/dipeptide ABC transporter ATP-binding protein
VPGNLPDLRRGDLPACRFAERCERTSERCRSERPRLDGAVGHGVACWHPLREAASLREPAHA